MENAKIRPLATPKPLNRSSQKLAGVIMSWTAPGMQNFVAIGSGFLFPKYVILPCFCMGWLCSFFWFFNKATACTPGRIFTQNTSNDVVPGKEVSFGGLDDYILYLDPYISEKPPFRGPILTGLSFFATENRFTLGMLKYELPLIVMVAA